MNAAEAVPATSDNSQSPELDKFALALSKAQGQFGTAKKDATNPHFKSRYADLSSIMEACRKPLSDNGLAVMQRVGTSAEGVSVTTHIIHSSGQWVKDTCTFPVAQRTPQGFGSAITYARRYSLAAALGIVADEDDDGNAASGPANDNRKPTLKEKLTTHLAPKPTPDAQMPQALEASVQAGEVWKSIRARAESLGLEADEARLMKIIKVATGKTKRIQLTPDDFFTVEGSLKAVAGVGNEPEVEPPPHGDDDGPPF